MVVVPYSRDGFRRFSQVGVWCILQEEVVASTVAGLG